MKIVVDTNIVFSAILNSKSNIGKILLRSHENIQFYSCNYLRAEIKNHRVKLLKLTKLSEVALTELEEIITQKITFIDERLIPEDILSAAQKRLQDIDEDDTVFVALADLLKGTLWTGDKQLYKGLKMKNYSAVLLTAELSLLIDES
ncbi:putative nucleic acid-binding protein [Pedobacter sp. UYP30]|uniref:PIN domain-containing protein n=1 Tax=Pedobacter sp. UYP30 TaxID=1756400 RepID=UPI003395BFEF